jgi:uncharacterized protein YjbJ (UPF0337 family)
VESDRPAEGPYLFSILREIRRRLPRYPSDRRGIRFAIDRSRKLPVYNYRGKVPLGLADGRRPAARFITRLCDESRSEQIMSTQEKMAGNWNQVKGKVKQKWGQLTDDELSEVEGNFDQLVGLVQQKTGQARDNIERILHDISEQAGGTFTQATETARQYAGQAAEQLRGAAGQARDRTMEGYEQAAEMIRRRPAESVAIAFGTGILLGIVVGLIAGSRD